MSKSKKLKKVIISVSGGVVQNVITNSEDVQVILFDWDNIGEGDGAEYNFGSIVSDEELKEKLEEYEKEVEEEHEKNKNPQ